MSASAEETGFSSSSVSHPGWATYCYFSRGEEHRVRRALLALMTVLLAGSTVLLRGGHPPMVEQPAAAAILPLGGEPVHLDPARFTASIDHPYWPMRPGSRWVYRQTDGDGDARRIEVTVTDRTRTILGIRARVVHDVVTEDGEVTEDTYDWYAQDDQGNLWYLGEDTRKLDDGKVTSREGSWQAGVDGAQPGIMLPARPNPGMVYRQEYDGLRAQDTAAVLSLDQRAKVPSGLFDHVLITKEFTPLEPKLLKHDFYALGVGPVLSLTVSGGSDREELLRYAPAP
jgi:hypothetical protein